MKKNIFLLSAVLMLASCDFFDNIGKFENYVESVEFKNGKYNLTVGDCDICYVNANPSDSFDFYECYFDTDEKNIIEIIDTSNNYCIIKGLNEGSCILTCTLGSKQCKCIIKVRGV